MPQQLGRTAPPAVGDAHPEFRNGFGIGAPMNRRLLQVGFTLAFAVYCVGYVLRDDLMIYIPGLAVAAVLAPLSFWWLHRASAGTPSRLLAVAIGALAVTGLVLASSPTSIGIAWVGLLVLCFEFPVIVSVLLTIFIGGAALVWYLGLGMPPFGAVGEAAWVMFVFALGIYFAVLLKRVAAAEIERNVALDELEDANSELRRRLAAEEDLVVAEERARVAAALHDGLGHRLTSIVFLLDFSERMVERDPLRTREEISNARATASEALDEMRRVVRAMHPVTTDPEDPLGSLRAIAESFHSTGLQLEFVRIGQGTPPREAGLLMVRFVQEALTNVVRHSGATAVQLRVDTEGEEFVITLDDNGHGSKTANGYGIPSLRERAESQGGTVTLAPHGGIDGGFRIEIRLPGAVQ